MNCPKCHLYLKPPNRNARVKCPRCSFIFIIRINNGPRIPRANEFVPIQYEHENPMSYEEVLMNEIKKLKENPNVSMTRFGVIKRSKDPLVAEFVDGLRPY